MNADHETDSQASAARENVPVERDDAGRLTVPVLPLLDSVIFPKSVYPLTLQGEHIAGLAEATEQSGGFVAIFQQRPTAGKTTAFEDLHATGVLARLTGVSSVDDNQSIRAEAVGVAAVQIVAARHWEPHLIADVELVADHDDDPAVIARLSEQAAAHYWTLLERNPEASAGLTSALEQTQDANDLVYLIGSTIPISTQAQQALLDLRSTTGRLARVITYLKKATEVSANRSAAPSTSPEAIYDRVALDRAEIQVRLESAQMSSEAREVTRREVDRLETLTTASPDYNLVRTYLQTLADLPWWSSPEPDVDLHEARALLDRDHYGVAEVKSRILEHLAVRKLRSQRTTHAELERNSLLPPTRQPVLCLVGPPGVGKTSLGRSIAAALDRPFVRISLGGVSDEAEIRGHRRTYVGAMPGRIVQALLRTGSNRPVIMLDELDKIGPGPKGDPSAALLDVLDPEQQREFVDQYLDVPFDISGIVFIATANTLDGVPAALRDRLEIIRVPGYTEEEKAEIASRHVIPRQMQWHALSERDLLWQQSAIIEVIRRYTREAGVRQLDREIATICRRVAAIAAQPGARRGRVSIGAPLIGEVLGPPRFLADEPVHTDQPGVVTGVFWTPVGGDVMHVEAVLMPGHKTLTVTGQLGEVMRESAQAALSYVRSSAQSLGIDPAFYEHNDIHLHVPSGAVAKDGPSAGVTMALALVSLLTGSVVPADVALTGEITLTGRVLPVGGIKEKVLAARRFGVRTVIMPTKNRRDLEDVQPEALADISVRFVDNMDDVLDACFPGGRRKPTPIRRVSRRGLRGRRSRDYEDEQRPEAAAAPGRT